MPKYFVGDNKGGSKFDFQYFTFKSMETEDFFSFCSARPSFALKALFKWPQLFGRYDNELLNKAVAFNNHEKIRFYEGYYLAQARNISSECKEYIDRNFKGMIHPKYIEVERNKNSICNLM